MIHRYDKNKIYIRGKYITVFLKTNHDQENSCCGSLAFKRITYNDNPDVVCMDAFKTTS